MVVGWVELFMVVTEVLRSASELTLGIFFKTYMRSNLYLFCHNVSLCVVSFLFYFNRRCFSVEHVSWSNLRMLQRLWKKPNQRIKKQ